MDVLIYEDDPTWVVKWGTRLELRMKRKFAGFFMANHDIFALSHSNMCGVSPKIIMHVLNINPKAIQIRQKRRMLGSKRINALKEECEKMLANGFIKESFHPR